VQFALVLVGYYPPLKVGDEYVAAFEQVSPPVDVVDRAFPYLYYLVPDKFLVDDAVDGPAHSYGLGRRICPEPYSAALVSFQDPLFPFADFYRNRSGIDIIDGT